MASPVVFQVQVLSFVAPYGFAMDHEVPLCSQNWYW